MTKCPECGEVTVTFTSKPEVFTYGLAPYATELTAVIEEGICGHCGLHFTDQRAEDARTLAVQTYLDKRTQAYDAQVKFRTP
jgi:hypothetical protein